MLVLDLYYFDMCVWIHVVVRAAMGGAFLNLMIFIVNGSATVASVPSQGMSDACSLSERYICTIQHSSA